MDNLPPPPAPPRAKKPKLRATTLKRLTTVAPHKIRHDNRHFPAGAGVLGSSSGNPAAAILQQQRPTSAGQHSDEGAGSPTESANERRKRFLTMSNLKRVFRALDLSDDGFIDVDELFEACRKIGGKLSREEIEDIIWEVDDDRDGKLSMADYLTTYRRSQADVGSSLPGSGFQPKRFYAIVEFLLMDRDCSGEITLDEAMTTIFERQGADNLAEVTQGFFRAAGMLEGEREPPPGTTITFSSYFDTVGREKPKVPSIVDVRGSYSRRLFADTFGHEPPRLRPSTSAGMLPILLAPPSRPQSVPGDPFGLGRSSSSSSLLTRGGTAPGSSRSSARAPLSPPSGASRASRLGSVQRTPSGGLQPLKHDATHTSKLALSALQKVGGHTQVVSYKAQAAGALKLDRQPSPQRPNASLAPPMMA